MNVIHTLTTISFILGLIPALLLFVLYGLRTAWNETVAGRAVFYLVTVTAASYGLTVAVLLFPGAFDHHTGEWFRVGTRFVIASMLWNLLFLFLRAQGFGERRSRKKSSAPAGADDTTEGK